MTITVLDAAGDTLQLHETWTGRFSCTRPRRSDHARFSQPGCLAGRRGGGHPPRAGRGPAPPPCGLRRELHHRPEQPLRYDGAVGTIASPPRAAGLMAVERHPRQGQQGDRCCKARRVRSAPCSAGRTQAVPTRAYTLCP